MRISFLIIVFSVLVLLFISKCSIHKPDNVFYAQNTMDGFQNAPASSQEKAELLRTIGYDGLEGFGFKDFFELKHALAKEGLKMPVNYVALNFEAGGITGDSTTIEIKEMIKSSDRGSVIYFHLHSKNFESNKETGDEIVSGLLRDLSDFAASSGVKLCVYPHVSTYCETVAHSVKLAKMVGRKNFGAAMNLCHLLKVEGSESIVTKIKEYTPFLFAVNICGADDGDTKNLGWDRLIQPLGQGSFDTYHFMKLLWDNGYAGPVGLQCYNLKGDAAETLTQSLKTWEKYKKQYTEEK